MGNSSSTPGVCTRALHPDVILVQAVFGRIWGRALPFSCWHKAAAIALVNCKQMVGGYAYWLIPMVGNKRLNKGINDIQAQECINGRVQALPVCSVIEAQSPYLWCWRQAPEL